MSDEPDATVELEREHPVRAESRHGARAEIGVDDVRRGLLGADQPRQLPGTRVILGEAVDHPLERHEPRRGEDPGLVDRRAAEPLQVHPRARYRLAVAGEDRSEWGRQPLVQAQRDGVDRRREPGERNAERDRGVGEAGAVEVGPRSSGGERGRLGGVDHGASVPRVRVLEADQISAAGVLERDRGEARDLGQPAALVHEDVCALGERRAPAGPGE